MKKIIPAVISFIIIFSSIEANAQTCSFSGKGNTFIQLNPCAPSEVQWNIVYSGLNENNTNEVIVDWGDGVTVPIVAQLQNLSPTGSKTSRKWEVDVSHSYPQGLGDCQYTATVFLIVNGTQCDVNSEQTQNVEV